MSRTVPARQRPSFVRRTWLSAFAAFALLSVAWSLAMPADGTTDERQHLERAYGAVTGHLLAPQGLDPLVHRPGAAFEVPKSLLPPNALCVYFPNFHQDQSWVARSAACQHPAPATHAKIRVVSWVGRYNPLYYLAVGGPLRLWPDMTGIVLSRILAALLASAFAATAALVAIRTHRPLLLAALLTVLTPTAIALNSTVNPNGVEIAAALLLWVCLVDLVRPGAVAGEAGGAAPAKASTAGVLRLVTSEDVADTARPARGGLLGWLGLRRATSGAGAGKPSAGLLQRLGLRRGAPAAAGPGGAARAVSGAAAGTPSAGVLRRGVLAEPGAAAGLSRGGLLRRLGLRRGGPAAAAGSPAISQPVLLALAALSGAVVLTVRAEGPFWFALAVCGSLAAAERGRIRELVRWRAVRLVGVAWVVVGGLAMAWNVVSGNDKAVTTLIAVHPADHRIITLLRLVVVNRVGAWFDEAFALDVQASWVPMVWAALAAAVLIPLGMLRGRRVVVVALAVAAASLGVTVVLEIKFLGTFGWSQYGRYFLPGLAGTAVLVASGPDGELPAVLRRRIPRLFAVGAAGCQLWVLAVEMTRVQAGPDAPLNPLGGSWHPAVGSLTVLAVAALGAAALIAVVWAATATTAATTATPGSPAAAPAPPGTAAAATAAPTATSPAAPTPITAPTEPHVVPEPANS